MDFVRHGVDATEKGKRMYLPALARPWVLGMAANNAEADGTARGLTDDDMESPLDQTIVKDLMIKFKKEYKITLSPSSCCGGTSCRCR